MNQSVSSIFVSKFKERSNDAWMIDKQNDWYMDRQMDGFRVLSYVLLIETTLKACYNYVIIYCLIWLGK